MRGMRNELRIIVNELLLPIGYKRENKYIMVGKSNKGVKQGRTNRKENENRYTYIKI